MRVGQVLIIAPLMIYQACCLHLLRPAPVASPNPPCLAGYGHPQPVERAVDTSPATVQRDCVTPYSEGGVPEGIGPRSRLKLAYRPEASMSQRRNGSRNASGSLVQNQESKGTALAQMGLDGARSQCVSSRSIRIFYANHKKICVYWRSRETAFRREDSMALFPWPSSSFFSTYYKQRRSVRPTGLWLGTCSQGEGRVHAGAERPPGRTGDREVRLPE